MKKVIFIGNRLNVINHIAGFPDLTLVKVYAEEGSLLSRRLPKLHLPGAPETQVFSAKDKAAVLAEIAGTDYDILISNGCPLILPVAKMQTGQRLFLNIHPTVLPDLKGKTPLNGVFLTHRKYIGATMHYIDPGVDTGNIIAQVKTRVTPDLDQGLVYKISFDLEADVFVAGMKKLIAKRYEYPGLPQTGEGSYFNRTRALQTIDPHADNTELMLDKIRSFGIKGQGSYLALGAVTYRVYAAERIINDYLLKTYSRLAVGTVAFEYGDKFVFRSSDGLIKVTDFELLTTEGTQS